MCGCLYFRNRVVGNAMRSLYNIVGATLQLQPTIDDLLTRLGPTARRQQRRRNPADDRTSDKADEEG
jgi:hypothetical protein